MFLQYTSEFVQSQLLSRRLAYFCCKKLSQICTDSSASLPSPSSQSPAAATSSASNEYAVCIVNVWTTATPAYLSELVQTHAPPRALCSVAYLFSVASSFLAYTPNWPVAVFLLVLHPPGTLYLLTFNCAKTFSLSNAT